jgi:hypothetical protein
LQSALEERRRRPDADANFASKSDSGALRHAEVGERSAKNWAVAIMSESFLPMRRLESLPQFHVARRKLNARTWKQPLTRSATRTVNEREARPSTFYLGLEWRA